MLDIPYVLNTGASSFTSIYSDVRNLFAGDVECIIDSCQIINLMKYDGISQFLPVQVPVQEV